MRNYLPAETVKQPDAIEQLICKPMEIAPRKEMSKEMTEIYIKLCFIPKNTMKLSEEEKSGLFIFRVIEKALQYRFTFKIEDERVILLLCHIAESTGQVIMYLTYLQYWCKKNDIKVLDFETFGMKIFPMGFPSAEDLSNIWDSTKVRRESGSDNLIDYQSAAVSIQFQT
jgi:hypothetical protein